MSNEMIRLPSGKVVAGGEVIHVPAVPVTRQYAAAPALRPAPLASAILLNMLVRK